MFNFAYSLKLRNMRNGSKYTEAAPICDKVVFSKVKQGMGGNVRLVLSGAARLATHVEEFMKVVSCPHVLQGYGLTETCAGTFVSIPHEMDMLGAVGPPVPNVDVCLESVREMGYDALSSRPHGERAAKVYKDEVELETYIHSDLYGAYDNARNYTNPKIKGAVVFHTQGPRMFDYSIRLNHTWALSGFPDVKSIIDINGPYLNDLHLGVNVIPIMQYGFSGFLTLQQVMDSFIILAAQQLTKNSDFEELVSFSDATLLQTQLKTPWTQFSPSNI